MASLDSKKKIITEGVIASLLIAGLSAPSFGSPHFDGLLSAIPTDTNSIALGWNPAQDDQKPTSQITYLIYQTARNGAENYDQPSYTTKNTSYRINGLVSNTTYYYVVRAQDGNGQIDPNRVERSATTFGRWVKQSTAVAPSPRLAHGMDYDKDTGKLILFGGRNGEGTLNDIWIFDSINNKWSHRTPSTTLRPSTRTARSIAYIDKKFITVGGINSTTPLSMNHETWIYSLANDAWVQSPTLADSTGYGISPNFVYDDVNKVVVLFGGRTGSAEGHVNRTGETWEFDVNHGTWTQIFPDTSPSPRKHHALVYDSTNRKAIMFGGEISTGFSNETWSYDASTDSWTQLFPDLSPSPRSNIEMVYDAQNHQVILFGGFLPGGNPIKITNETWVYDITANTWFQVNSPQVPEPRFHHAMVYDPVGKKVVMFGGGITLCQSPHCFITSGFVNDTWVYK